MVRRLAAVLVVLLMALPLSAQQDTVSPAPMEADTTLAAEYDPAVVLYDTARIDVRSVEAAVEKFRNDPEFAYDRDIALPPSFWQKFRMWLWELLDALLPDNPNTRSLLLDLLLYGVVIGALLYLVFRLTGMSFTGLLGRSGKRVIPTEMVEENIHLLDFDQLISDALREQNYRRAVRLLYLRTLRELSDSGHIRWSIDKTNRDYIAELPSGDIRRAFEQLTLLFEYIWYGDFPVDRQLFDHSRALFSSFSATAVQHV